MNAGWSLPPALSSPYTAILAVALVCLVLFLVARHRRGTSHRRREAMAMASRPFARGFDLLLDARWQETADVLKEAVEVDPDRTPEYLALGKLFRRQGELSRAARMFEQLLARPKLDRAARIMAQYELALAYHALGWQTTAAETLEQVLGIDPAHAGARRELRRIHEEMGRWDTAAALELLRLQRGEATERRTLAALLTQQGKVAWGAGNLRASAAHLRSALALDPEGIEAALYLGRILLRQGKVQQAFHLWDGLAQARPEFLFLAFRDMQEAFRRLQDEAGWERFLRAFTERYPGDPTGYLALAEWYEARGQIEAAMRGLQRVLDLDPGCREAHLALLALYRTQGISSDVLDAYERLAKGAAQPSGGRFRCLACGDTRDEPFWKCPRCHAWATAERRIPPASARPILAGDITPPLGQASTGAAPVVVTRDRPMHPTPGA